MRQSLALNLSVFAGIVRHTGKVDAQRVAGHIKFIINRELGMQRLTGKVVLVTGAGSGIGRASAQRVAAEGAAVCCLDIDGTAAENAAQAINRSGGQAISGACDVGDEAAVQACVADCVAQLGHLDALVNMAGVLRFDDTEQLSRDSWQRVIDVNLTGTMLLNREVLPHLVKSGGSIVNAASTASLAGLPSIWVLVSESDFLGLPHTILQNATFEINSGSRDHCRQLFIVINMNLGIGFAQNGFRYAWKRVQLHF